MLIKRSERSSRPSRRPAFLDDANGTLDRRAFLRRSGLVAGGLSALGALPLGTVRKATAAPPPALGAEVALRKNICTHCAFGCTATAEVSNAVRTAQEPSGKSPINRARPS